ncbi:MAG TPA: Nif3-like dinuclear metal center hexameric protein [Feifaniaceae bacterium]|nr:Nif3-like dinuclear metal center hexameric protein [Feifaniaceae bacterium]
MKLSDFTAVMERLAPADLALEFDNPGLLIEPDHGEIKRVLVALDCTKAVAEEAAELGADLVLTHHPLFFLPVQQLWYSAPETAAACVLVRHGIGLFSAHTNLDAAQGGVNDTLCERMGVLDTIPFDEGVGRVGTLKEPITLSEFASRAEQLLQTSVRIAGNPNAAVKRIAVMGGSGGSSIRPAADERADVLLTGEIKHSDAIDAVTLGLNVIVAGHYETECVVLEPLIRRLQNECFDVQYNLSRADANPFVRL